MEAKGPASVRASMRRKEAITMNRTKQAPECSINNIYQLDGRVPLGKAIPFGLQHILAMFVSNLAPITLIAASAQPALSQAEVAILLQNAMFVAGIATLIQLYPIWKVGSKLPVVMGVSFTFVAVLSSIAANYGYPSLVGAVIVGGLMEGTLGLLAKYWRKIITPIVAASVVTAIGFSLFTVGTRSFGGGYAEDFGSAQNLLLGVVTLAACLLWNTLAKGYLKQLSVLAGLVVGYIVAIFMGKVDLGTLMSGGLIALPRFLPYMPQFHPGAVASACIIFLVSAAETIGDTSALVSGGLGREITSEEISGSLACDGYASTIAALFGCPPVTSFSQNVGLVAMTKVVNRFALATGAVFLILCGLCPKLGALVSIMPQSVLGGAAVMMFSSIVISGIQLITKEPLTSRNLSIVAVALGVGYGMGANTGILAHTPQTVQLIFGGSGIVPAAMVAILLNILLPKDKKETK